MKRILSLTKVMIQSSADALLNMGFSKKKKKKRSKPLQILGYIVLFAYLSGLVYFASSAVIKSFVGIGATDIPVYLLFIGITAYLTLTGIIIVPTVFYFSQDIERYLVMPIKSYEIMIAKFLTSLVSTYISMFFITIPFGIAYIAHAQPEAISVFFYIVANLLLPLFPLAFALLFTVLLFRFVPFFKNKDRFQYISIAIVFVFTMFGILMGSSLGGSSPGTVQTDALWFSLDAIMPTLNIIAPSASYLARAVVDSNPIALCIGIAFSLITAVGGIALTQGLYFKGVVGIGEKNAKKRSMSDSETYSKSITRSKLSSLILNDVRLIIRTPALFLNYFLMMLIMPLTFLVPMLMSGGFASMIAEIKSVQLFVEKIPMTTMLAGSIAVGFIFSFFISGMNTLASTSFSREGRTMLSYQVMPVSMKDLMHAKLLLATICNTIVPILVGIIAEMFLRFNILYLILYIVFVIIGALCDATLSITSDIMFPKLDWDDVQQALIQNFIAVIPIFLTVGITIALIISVIKVGPTVTVPLGITVLIVLSLIMYRVNTKLLTTHLSKKLEEL